MRFLHIQFFLEESIPSRCSQWPRTRPCSADADAVVAISIRAAAEARSIVRNGRVVMTLSSDASARVYRGARVGVAHGAVYRGAVVRRGVGIGVGAAAFPQLHD